MKETKGNCMKEYVVRKETKQDRKKRLIERRKERHERKLREQADKLFTKWLNKRNGRHGVCCRGFHITMPPTDVKTEMINMRNECMMGALTPKYTRNTIALLLPLLKPLYSSSMHGHWYTCRAFNEKTGKCDIHDCKPQICQLFKPTEQFCVEQVKCKNWKFCKAALEVTSNEIRSAEPTSNKCTLK